MKVVIDTHPLWDAQICSLFAGILMLCTDPDVKKLAASNFRKYYKTLSVSDREKLQIAISDFRKDPAAAMREYTEMSEEFFNDQDIIDRIKKSGE